MSPVRLVPWFALVALACKGDDPADTSDTGDTTDTSDTGDTDTEDPDPPAPLPSEAAAESLTWPDGSVVTYDQHDSGVGAALVQLSEGSLYLFAVDGDPALQVLDSAILTTQGFLRHAVAADGTVWLMHRLDLGDTRRIEVRQCLRAGIGYSCSGPAYVPFNEVPEVASFYSGGAIGTSADGASAAFVLTTTLNGLAQAKAVAATCTATPAVEGQPGIPVCEAPSMILNTSEARGTIAGSAQVRVYRTAAGATTAHFALGYVDASYATHARVVSRPVGGADVAQTYSGAQEIDVELSAAGTLVVATRTLVGGPQVLVRARSAGGTWSAVASVPTTGVRDEAGLPAPWGIDAWRALDVTTRAFADGDGVVEAIWVAAGVVENTSGVGNTRAFPSVLSGGTLAIDAAGTPGTVTMGAPRQASSFDQVYNAGSPDIQSVWVAVDRWGRPRIWWGAPHFEGGARVSTRVMNLDGSWSPSEQVLSCASGVCLPSTPFAAASDGRFSFLQGTPWQLRAWR